MRSLLTATLMFVRWGFRAGPDDAAVNVGSQAEAGNDAPVRPALQTPPIPQGDGAGERLAIQSDLAWVGQYNGAITAKSATAWSRHQGIPEGPRGKQTGVLNPQERGILAETAKRDRTMSAGRSSPMPAPGTAWPATKLVPQQTSDANGAKWTSPPAPSRFSCRGARKPTRPPQNSPIKKRSSPPGAR